MKTIFDPWTNKIFYAFLNSLVATGAITESTHSYLQEHFGTVLFVEFLFYMAIVIFFFILFVFFFKLLDIVLKLLASCATSARDIADSIVIIIKVFRK